MLAGETSTGARGQAGEAVPKGLLNALIAAVFVITLIKRLAGASSENFIGTFSDDFYYYLKTAMNVAVGRGSTFDGSIPTNGYHPLWMAVITLLVFLTGSGAGTLIPLAFIISGATALTFALSQRLAARLLGRSGVASLLIALYSTAYFYIVAKHGMEINVTVPLMMYLALRTLDGRGALSSPRETLVTGALCGVLVLSRTDTVIFVMMYLLAVVSCRKLELAELVRTGVYFGVGFIPVLLYLALNVHYFGGILPVSGAAKQLAVGVWTHPTIRGFEFSNGIHYVFVFPVLAANALALLALALRKGSESKLEVRAALLPMLIFPQAFYLLQICMNDWPFWDWYLYPWLAAAPIALALPLRLLGDIPERVELALQGAAARRLPALCVAGAALGLGAAVWDYRKPIEQSTIHSFAIALTEFAKTHPGRYGMGDRAGMVGFLLPFPLVQLEGLMEDRKFLQNIAKRRDLVEVLNEYEIDYYASSSAELVDGCYRTTEPKQAGPSSPRMVGRFCQKPVLIYKDAYDRTLVFAIERSPAP